jgi:hypothetical protein
MREWQKAKKLSPDFNPNLQVWIGSSLVGHSKSASFLSMLSCKSTTPCFESSVECHKFVNLGEGKRSGTHISQRAPRRGSLRSCVTMKKTLPNSALCVGRKYKRKIATSIFNHALKQEVTRNQASPGNNMRGSNGLVLYAPEETYRRPTTFRRPREQAGLSVTAIVTPYATLVRTE